jgi:NADH-quinone oxidoreductase subunit G
MRARYFVQLRRSDFSLPLQLSEGLTAGQVGLPMGMPGIAPVLAGARLENLQEAKA